MKSVNRATLMGHVVADPELRSTKSGKLVATFALATNNEWLDSDGEQQRSVDFHRIVSWEALAKLCKDHVKKGSPLYLEGRLVNRSYEDKDKNRRFITEVVSERINLLRWEAEKKEVATKELVSA